MDDQLNQIRKEIATLEEKAREYMDWLIDHTESPNWFEVKSCYNDTLFKIATKKEKIEALRTGNRAPETTSLPSRDTRHNKQF